MNPSSTETVHALRAELAQAGVLLVHLQAERDALVAADIEQIGACAVDKSAAVEALARLTRARHEQMTAAGFALNSDGARTWLAQAASRAENEAIVPLWDELICMVRLTKECNRVNGILIERHLQKNSQALDTLRQGEAPSLYGPNGQTRSTPHQRTLVVG